MKKGWKIFTIVAGIVVLVVAGFLYWSTWEGSTEEIESVANEFKPKPQWIQADNQVIPPKTVCLDEKCPSIHRSWKTNDVISMDTFKTILDEAGWNFTMRGDCQPDPRISGPGSSLCIAEGENEGYEIAVDVVESYDSNFELMIILRLDRP